MTDEGAATAITVYTGTVYIHIVYTSFHVSLLFPSLRLRRDQATCAQTEV